MNVIDTPVCFYRAHTILQRYQNSLSVERLPRDAVDEARAYMVKHLFDPNATIQSMELQLVVRDRDFATRFRLRFGLTPKAFWLAHRLEAASRLIAETNLTISAIAHLVGYRNSNGLSMAFKNEFGCCPSAYRN